MTTDEMNREHYVTPRTGALHIVNRVSAFHPATIESHVNDLIPLLGKESASVCILVTDNGPDWATTSPGNLLSLMRIWRDANLDLLVVVTYCPGHSSLNMIEHAWAPRSRDLTSVSLPDKLPGDDVPPCKQKLSAEEKREKEGKVHDWYTCNHFFSDRSVHFNVVLNIGIGSKRLFGGGGYFLEIYI